MKITLLRLSVIGKFDKKTIKRLNTITLFKTCDFSASKSTKGYVINLKIETTLKEVVKAKHEIKQLTGASEVNAFYYAK